MSKPFVHELFVYNKLQYVVYERKGANNIVCLQRTMNRFQVPRGHKSTRPKIGSGIRSKKTLSRRHKINNEKTHSNNTTLKRSSSTMSEQNLLDFGEEAPTTTTNSSQQQSTSATSAATDYRTQISNVQQEIIALQNQIYTLRFHTEFDDVNTWKNDLRKQLALLRKKEDELSRLRKLEMRQFKQQLDLESLHLDPPVKLPAVAISTPSSAASSLNTLATSPRRRAASMLQTGGGTGATGGGGGGRRRGASFNNGNTEIGAAARTSGGGPVRSSVDGGSGRALQNWSNLLTVTNAANKWKNTWETNKMNRAQSLLDKSSATTAATTESSSGDDFTREQILELRSALFRLKQKKHLSLKEKILKENLANRLRNLDRTRRGATQEDVHQEVDDDDLDYDDY